MNKFIKSFSDKKFRYGAFSTLTVTLVIAVLVAVNLVVSLFDIRFDLSMDQRYSISEKSKEILAGLTENVTIYALFKTGGENLMYKTLLDEYEQSSKYISVVYKDPFLYPQFVNDYNSDGADIPEDSIIVESSKRFKVIRADELYTLGFDSYNYGSTYVKSIDFEPQVTNAVKYVTEESTPAIYQITNHNEPLMSDDLKKQISLANYDIKELNTVETAAIPEDASLLFLAAPERDYSPHEAQLVRDYLAGGGRAIVLTDYRAKDFPNYLSIIEAYGLELGSNLVFEGSLSNTWYSTPYFILPNFSNHEIVSSFQSNNIYVLLESGSSLNRLSEMRNSIKIEPLLTTSRQAYAKSGQAASLNKEPGDEEGPFDLAVAITDSVYIPDTIIAKLVVVNSASVMDLTGFPGNGDFIVNSINWLNDKDNSVYIRPFSSSGPENLIINDSHGRLLSITSTYVIPGAIVIAGIAVWLRRRNR